MRVLEIKRKGVNKKPRAEVEDMIKKMRKENEVMVKGQFEFIGAEGGFFQFTERAFPGDPITIIELIHGEICEIPMGIVKRINNTVHKITRYQNVEQTGKGPLKLPRTYETKARIKFVPLDYI